MSAVNLRTVTTATGAKKDSGSVPNGSVPKQELPVSPTEQKKGLQLSVKGWGEIPLVAGLWHLALRRCAFFTAASHGQVLQFTPGHLDKWSRFITYTCANSEFDQKLKMI